MCGITGIIHTSQGAISNESILQMTDTIRHRGPDGEGFLFTNAPELCDYVKADRPKARVIGLNQKQNVAFGHRRLSILDLNSAAAQPMTDATGRYWIVYSGEIYNYAELKKELTEKGYRFHTDHSDTEVLLNAYACWGVDCLKKFNGMWAFCIWDIAENTFFLARDRMGKKPLYYAKTDANFVFASELKALLKFPGILCTLNQHAIYDYLTYSSIPSPATIFSGIRKLEAAHYILFTPDERIEPKRYWTPLREENYLDYDEKRIAEELKEKLREATRLRYLADVEIGALLSGGLDSSVNLANISMYVSKPIKTFSVGFENSSDYRNELGYAKKVASHFNADYHELIVSEQNFIDFIPEMAYHHDEPTCDPASILLFYISKVAREHGVKVLLSGEGSDELLVGYELWRLANQFNSLFEGKPNLTQTLGLIHKLSPLKNKRKYYHNWYWKTKQGLPVFWSGTEVLNENEKRAQLSKEVLNKIENYNSFVLLKDLHAAFKAMPRKDFYDWMISADLHNRLPDLLLARLDRMAMAASVETRNPFLDVNVVEYAMKIPSGLKNKGNQQKYILKKAYEGILPHEIIYRPKDSFPVPLQKIFSGKANRDICISAFEKFNDDTNFFHKSYVDELRETADMNVFWNISNLALWYVRYMKENL